MRNHSDMNNSRRGVALIIVLGMLSVMTLLAVAFSVAMRIERMAARNYLNGVRAQQLIEVAFLNAGHEINTRMTTPFPKCYPDASVWVSAGGGGACNDLVSGEAQQAIPEALLSVAENATPQWTDASKGQVKGRVAFIALDTSGFMDANFVGGQVPKNYLSTGEIDITALPEIDDPDDFLKMRATYKRFETVQELRALGSQIGPNQSGQALASASNLYVYSMDVHRDQFFEEEKDFGTPSAKLKNKFYINGITNYNCYYAVNSVTKYTSDGDFMANYFGSTDGDWNDAPETLVDLLESAGIERATDVAWNIVNWLDEDRVPQGDDAQPWTHTEGGEAIPLINEIVSTVDATSIKMDVEFWFPFAPVKVEPSDNFYIQLAGWKGQSGPAYTSANPDLRAMNPDFWLEEPIDYMDYPDKQFKLFRLSVPLNQLGGNPLWFMARTVIKDGSQIYPVDEAGGDDVYGGNNTRKPRPYKDNRALSAIDPRSNNKNGDWYQTTATLGAINKDCKCWDRLPNVDPGYDYGYCQGLPIYCKDGLMQSIGEIGYIYRSNLNASRWHGAPWNLPNDDAFHYWQTIDLLHANRGAYLLDHATTRDPTREITTTAGLVSINTQQRDVLNALFHNMKIAYTDSAHPKRIPMDQEVDYSRVVDAIMKRSKEKPFVSFADMFRDENGQEIRDGGPIAVAIREAAEAVCTDREVNDKVREDMYRQILDMITFRQNIFTVLCAAQIVSPVDDTVVMGERRAIATIYRDSYTGGTFIRSFKWLGE